MNRAERARMGQNTLEILDAGEYAVDGQRIELKEDLQTSRSQTEMYPEERRLDDLPPPRFEATEITVVNQTTLEACRALVDAGHRAVALNFASAKNPGGGFLSGSQAQEESLARSSGLYAAIVDQPMYALHREQRDPMYTAYAMYSPAVPVFRNDAGDLLKTRYFCGFITAPAPNAGVVRQRRPGSESEIEAQMSLRIDRVLSIARLHEHDGIVLGAWGCGVFKNEPTMVAKQFASALFGKHQGAFRKVVFAVLDRGKKQACFEAFNTYLVLLGRNVDVYR